MNDICFVIDGTELYIEKVLAEFEVPLLFVCKDKFNKRYTALCVDSDEGRYLIVRSNNSDIVNMIQNTITMKELFLQAQNSMAWMISSGDSFEDDMIDVINIQDVCAEDLPADGAFYEVYNANVHDYVDMLLDRVPRLESVQYVTIVNNKFSDDILEKAAQQIQMLDFIKKKGVGNVQNINKISFYSEAEIRH